MPDLAQLLLLLTAVTGSSAMVGFLAWLVYRVKRLEGQLGQGDAAQVQAHVEALQEQIGALYGDMADLQERVDFAERLLARGTPEGDVTRNEEPGL